MNRFLSLLLGIILLGTFVTGCTATKVERIDSDKTVDLSGNWNDSDSRMVAQEMIKDALSQRWVDNFEKQNGKIPTVIVGTVVNRSYEHINVLTFIKDMERELTNSGRVQFVASKEERLEVREERKDQGENARPETVKPSGREMGADYMLKGNISSILDEVDGKKVVYYQVTLEMIDLESNIKVWYGDKKIKKLVKRTPLGL